MESHETDFNKMKSNHSNKRKSPDREVDVSIAASAGILFAPNSGYTAFPQRFPSDTSRFPPFSRSQSERLHCPTGVSPPPVVSSDREGNASMPVTAENFCNLLQGFPGLAQQYYDLSYGPGALEPRRFREDNDNKSPDQASKKRLVSGASVVDQLTTASGISPANAAMIASSTLPLQSSFTFPPGYPSTTSTTNLQPGATTMSAVPTMMASSGGRNVEWNREAFWSSGYTGGVTSVTSSSSSAATSPPPPGIKSCVKTKQCEIRPSLSSSASSTTSSSHQVPSRPQEMDVLFGRGRHHKNNPGNQRMQLLADIYRDAYYKADRDEKTRITKTIVMVIKRKGHRFLKFDKSLDEWREVSDETARHKIGHAMRDGRDRPDGPVDPKEVEDVPILSEDVRKSVERMLAFNRKESAQSFGQDEVDILSGLFANSSSTSPAGSEEGGNGSKPPSR